MCYCLPKCCESIVYIYHVKKFEARLLFFYLPLKNRCFMLIDMQLNQVIVKKYSTMQSLKDTSNKLILYLLCCTVPETGNVLRRSNIDILWIRFL